MVRVSKELRNARTVEEIVPFVTEAFGTFGAEFASHGYLKKVHDCLSRAWLMQAKDLSAQDMRENSQRLNELAPHLKDTTTVLQTLTEITTAIGESSSLKHKCLLGCLRYLVAVEGIFDQAIYSILEISLIAQNRKVRPSANKLLVLIGREKEDGSNERGLYDELKDLIGQEDTSVLFEGYDKTIRNGIAHASFQISTDNHSIIFRNPWKQNETVTQTIEGLSKRFDKMIDVCNYVAHFIVLIFILGYAESSFINETELYPNFRLGQNG